MGLWFKSRTHLLLATGKYNKNGCRPHSSPGAKRHGTMYVHTVKIFHSFSMTVAKYPLGMVLGMSPAWEGGHGGGHGHTCQPFKSEEDGWKQAGLGLASSLM